MLRELRWRFVAVGAITLIMVAVAAQANAGEESGGDKARIAVGDFRSKTGDCSGDEAAAIGGMLADALANTGKFVVLDEEEDLVGGSGVLVRGTVKKFEVETGGGGLGGLRKKALGKVGIDEKAAEIELEIEIVDAADKRSIKKKTIKTGSAQWTADVTGGTWVGDLDLEESLAAYAGEPMEGAIRTALAETVALATEEIPKEYFSYTGEEKIAAGSGGAAPGEGATGTSSGPAAEDMSLYVKYDFVPGNKVIFYDDMKGEEEGEFPYRWNLDHGVFEVVRLGKEYWIMCTDEGSVRPKIQDAPLPPKYTVEMEFYDNGPGVSGHYFDIYWVDRDGDEIGLFYIRRSRDTYLSILGEEKASKTLQDKLPEGVHVMRIMATSRSIKCFIDNVRVANVPKVEGFNPVGFMVRTDPWSEEGNPVLFRGFRFAEGGKTMREQLDEEGKIVTHGILFDPDSYTIKGESYKTLKDIGSLLEDDPDLRLSIEGHTDSDGSDEHNMTLSQNRAASVRDYLISAYGIETGRLEAKGWGESEPIDTNDSAEGKANNRRVELVRL
jgi:OOP family OmpA-OmpF porin